MCSRVGEILPGEEVTVTERYLDVFDRLEADNEINLVSGEITRANGANVLTRWGLRSQGRDTIVAIPEVTRIREPERMIVKFQVDFLGRLCAQLETQIMNIAPPELIHQPVFVVVR